MLLILQAGTGEAKIYLDINAPSIQKLPLAIQSFRDLAPEAGDPSVGKEIQETLEGDLAFSGLFDVLDPVIFIEDPATSKTDVQNIHFPDWRAIGADALIKGTYTTMGEKLKVEFFLYDVFREKQLVGKRYHGMAGDLRKMAHKFANEVVKQITGEEGVFDTRVVYLASSREYKEIHVMDYDGHNDKVLFKDEAIIVSPKWSSDGEKIVFTSYRENNPDLYQIVVRTGSLQKISGQPGINTGGAYSPGGGRLAYVMSKDGNPEIYILDKYARSPKRLTKNWATDVSPVWSPDGEKIAYMSDQAGSPQVYVMNDDGKKPYRLTFQGKYNATPAWSPRGDRIAFATQVNGHFQVATIKPNKTEMVILTANSGNNESPSWSPDGRFLCFSSTMNGKSDIFIMNANGANLKQVTSSGLANSAPNWSTRVIYD
jgi:TolB protein